MKQEYRKPKARALNVRPHCHLMVGSDNKPEDVGVGQPGPFDVKGEVWSAEMPMTTF